MAEDGDTPIKDENNEDKQKEDKKKTEEPPIGVIITLILFIFFVIGLPLQCITSNIEYNSLMYCDKTNPKYAELYGFKEAVWCFDMNPQSILNHNIEKMRDLEAVLKQKEVETSSTKNNYESLREGVKNDLLKLKKEKKISSYQQTVDIPEVYQQLLLFEKYDSYTTELENFGGKLHDSLNEVAYLIRDAQADLAMVKVMDKKEIDGTVKKIQEVLKNNPNHKKTGISVTKLWPLDDLESAWDKATSGP